MPKTWLVREARARLGEVIDEARSEGPQIIRRHGEDVAVIVSVEDWRAMQPSLKEWLLTETGRTDDLLGRERAGIEIEGLSPKEL